MEDLAISSDALLVRLSIEDNPYENLQIVTFALLSTMLTLRLLSGRRKDAAPAMSPSVAESPIR